MMEFFFSKRFKKDRKKLISANKNIQKLDQVLQSLARQEILEIKYKDHLLKGDYIGFRECHIEPDWLLIYKIEGNKLFLERTGSHSELF